MDYANYGLLIHTYHIDTHGCIFQSIALSFLPKFSPFSTQKKYPTKSVLVLSIFHGVIMATFLNRTGADGTRKIKVLARVWLNGKQVNKIKTFSEKNGTDYEQEAKKWAEQTEQAMKAEKAKLLYQSTKIFAPLQTTMDLKLIVEDQQGMSVGDYLSSLKKAIEPLTAHFGEISLEGISAINTNSVWKYIMCRYEEKASQCAIETELQLLRNLNFKFNPEQKSDIVSLELQAAQADGANFN